MEDDVDVLSEHELREFLMRLADEITAAGGITRQTYTSVVTGNGMESWERGGYAILAASFLKMLNDDALLIATAASMSGQDGG